MPDTLSISHTSRSTPPRVPFAIIKDEVLHSSFEVSLVFIGEHLARKLNRERRGKTYNANVLTFPLSKHSGEIFINLARAKVEAVRYGVSYREWVLTLFIHGLLHLKGMSHGARMEEIERALVDKYR